MTSAPKRPWFRFHLLTAVLMMFAAGALMWANSIGRNYGTRPDGSAAISFGWPAPFNDDWGGFADLHPVYVAFDVVVALLILAIVFFVSEWIISHREVRMIEAEKELFAKAGAVFDRACGWGRTPYDPQVRAYLNVEGFDCSKKLEEVADKMGYGPDNLIVQETVKTTFFLFAIAKTKTEPKFVERMISCLELAEGKEDGKAKQ